MTLPLVYVNFEIEPLCDGFQVPFFMPRCQKHGGGGITTGDVQHIRVIFKMTVVVLYEIHDAFLYAFGAFFVAVFCTEA